MLNVANSQHLVKPEFLPSHCPRCWDQPEDPAAHEWPCQEACLKGLCPRCGALVGRGSDRYRHLAGVHKATPPPRILRGVRTRQGPTRITGEDLVGVIGRKFPPPVRVWGLRRRINWTWDKNPQGRGRQMHPWSKRRRKLEAEVCESEMRLVRTWQAFSARPERGLQIPPLAFRLSEELQTPGQDFGYWQKGQLYLPRVEMSAAVYFCQLARRIMRILFTVLYSLSHGLSQRTTEKDRREEEADFEKRKRELLERFWSAVKAEEASTGPPVPA